MQVSRRLNFFSHLCLRRLSCWGWCTAHITPQNPQPAASLLSTSCKLGWMTSNVIFHCTTEKCFSFLVFFFTRLVFCLDGCTFSFYFPMDGWMGKSMWGKILATYRVYFEVTSNHQAKRYNTSHSRGAPALLPTSSPSTSPPADTVAKTPVSDDGFGLFCWKPYSRTVSNWSRRIFTSSRDGFCTGIVFFYVFLF